MVITYKSWDGLAQVDSTDHSGHSLLKPRKRSQRSRAPPGLLEVMAISTPYSSINQSFHSSSPAKLCCQKKTQKARWSCFWAFWGGKGVIYPKQTKISWSMFLWNQLTWLIPKDSLVGKIDVLISFTLVGKIDVLVAPLSRFPEINGARDICWPPRNGKKKSVSHEL